MSQNSILWMLIFLIFATILLIVFCYFLYIWQKHQKQKELPINLEREFKRIEDLVSDKFNNINNGVQQNITKWTETLTKINNNNDRINELKTELQKGMESSVTKISENGKTLSQTVFKLQENLNNIRDVHCNIEKLNRIFYSTRTRGNLGEFSLYSILTNILGANTKIWSRQMKLNVDENKSKYGNIDALIHMQNKEDIAIDAKFPLDQYKIIETAITNKESNENIKLNKDLFRNSIKDKIKEVKKYISHKNNISNAILFVPSEAIFTYLTTELPDIFETSFQSKVWIASPTTLAALLHVIFQMQKDYEISKNLAKVKEIILDISKDFERFNIRWESIKKKIIDNEKNIRDLDTTIAKIQNKQEKLNNFNLNVENDNNVNIAKL